MGVTGLEKLEWLSRFIDQTPGDKQIGGKPRQVPGVSWSRVEPSIPPNPKLILRSK